MHIQQIKRFFIELASSKDVSPLTAHRIDPIEQVQLHSSFTCMCCIPDANALNRTEHAHTIHNIQSISKPTMAPETEPYFI